jgi:hypothetical protein
MAMTFSQNMSTAFGTNRKYQEFMIGSLRLVTAVALQGGCTSAECGLPVQR